MFKREKSRFSIENFLSHSTNKLRNGTRLSFTKILVSRNFMNKRGGGGVTIFRPNCFFFTVPNPFVGEPFCVSESFGYQKASWIKGEGGVAREYHIYLPKIFCLTVPKKYRRGTLCRVTKFRCRKNSCLNGFCLVFLSKIFCLAVHKIFVEELFCVSESFGIEKFRA